MQTLTEPAIDGSTYYITFEFWDKHTPPIAITPTSIMWTLINEHGAVINGRQDVIISLPAASVEIVVFGDDILFADGAKRIITVKALYDDPPLADLPLNDEAQFSITDLRVIPIPS